MRSFPPSVLLVGAVALCTLSWAPARTSAQTSIALAPPSPAPTREGECACAAAVSAPAVSAPAVSAGLGPALSPPPTASAAPPPADDLARRRRHARRLVRAGGTMVGLGIGGFAIAAIVIHATYTPSCPTGSPIPSDSWDALCVDVGPGLGIAATALFVSPVIVVGTIIAGRGGYLRNHMPGAVTVSLRPTVSRQVTGLALRVAF